MQTTKQQIPILTVSELTRFIKQKLEDNFKVVWLQGEISNAKLHTSGHFYFSLKDGEAQINAVMFRSAVSSLKSIPKDGDKVIVRGEITVYPPAGRYQILVHEMKPAGIGELLQKLEELKELLKKRGWFDPAHKKPIPKLPKKIGIVTSPTGAAIQDILNILKRRFSGVHIIINPVRVQGEGSAQEIAQAIRQFNEFNLVDVMIVGRGGGSIEDLWAFNEIVVAEAIFNSRIPIISAVGHETDLCISDLVADLRAPTPSAAAELVIAEKSEQLKTLGHLAKRIIQLFEHQTRISRQKLTSLSSHPLLASPYALLGQKIQRLDHLHKRLDMLRPEKQIALYRQRLRQLTQQIDQTFKTRLSERRRHLDAPGKTKYIKQCLVRFFKTQFDHFQKLKAALNALNPKNVLKKGYAIPFSEKEGSVITSTRHVKKLDGIRLVLFDGELSTTVNGIKTYDN